MTAADLCARFGATFGGVPGARDLYWELADLLPEPAQRDALLLAAVPSVDDGSNNGGCDKVVQGWQSLRHGAQQQRQQQQQQQGVQASPLAAEAAPAPAAPAAPGVEASGPSSHEPGLVTRTPAEEGVGGPVPAWLLADGTHANSLSARCVCAK